MDVCIGSKSGAVYCCLDESGALGDDFAGQHDALCCATVARVRYNVKTTENSNFFFRTRVPNMWRDSEMSLSFEGDVVTVLSFLSQFPADIYGQIQIGQFAVPKVVRLVIVEDGYKVYDSNVIVTNVSISQRGGEPPRIELQMSEYGGI